MDFVTKHPSQDRPIAWNRDDKLDRGPFVASLVRTLVRDELDGNGNLTGRRASGFIVGLTGKWGLGKSSILRLLELELGSMDRVIVSYFNPWMFNGRDELLRGFFSGLREAMGRSNTEHAREMAAALDRYWGSVDLAGHAVAAIVDTHGTGGVAKIFWTLWGKIAKNSLPKSKDLSPEKERKSLEQKIAKQRTAVVVLIDELDRLEDDEVRSVAQLVKAVGDIEGLSYLVAYDPERVADALGRGEGLSRQASGARYLEKIIQLPIPLRPLFDEDREALLQAELIHHDLSVPTSEAENQQAILAQIKSEISTPRDIKRLVGAFAVLERATRGEIEPIDVLAYAWIMTKTPALREALADNFDCVVADPGEQEMVAQLARRLDKTGEQQTPIKVIGDCAAAHSELLTQLFPRFRANRARDDDGTRLYRRRNFLRLLYLGNPPGAIPRAEIEHIWNLTDISVLHNALSELRTKGRLESFLDRLDDLLPQLPLDSDAIFWPVLSKVLTRSSDWKNGGVPEHGLVADAATTLLMLGMRDKRQKPRVKAAVEALINSGDLAITPWILQKQMYAHGFSRNNPSGGGESIYTKEETFVLMRTETERYRTAVLNGTALRLLPNVEAIYVIANQNAWDDELRSSFTQQLKGREAISTLAALILPPNHGADRSGLEQLFDVDVVSEEFKQIHFNDPPLEPWIQSSVRRLKAVLDGKDSMFVSDDDDEE